LLFTVDAYQIDIQTASSTLSGCEKRHPGLANGGFRQHQRNPFLHQRHQHPYPGIDLVTTYKTDFSERSRLSASLALTFNQTEISKIGDTPAGPAGQAPPTEFC
jgi:iron complex outermembrane receptor protein